MSTKKGKAKPSCLRCKAICAVHQLHCEEEAMGNKDFIDCKTFEEADRDG